MKYILTFTLGLCLSFNTSLFAQTKLSGDIKAIGNSSLIIEYYVGDIKKDTTLKIADGKFIWKAPIIGSQKITMVFPGRAIYIFVDPGEMTISGSRDSIDNLKVTGSKTNDEALAYKRLLQPLLDEEIALSAQDGKISDDQEREREEKMEAIARQKYTACNNYIRNHAESAFSLNLVTEFCRLGSYENVLKLYNGLGAKMKATAEGKRILARLAILRHSAVGEKMVDFTLNDTNGKPVGFSAFKGKYVLIDFWASWCYPCRKEIPNLIKNYNAYQNHNFTIVSISLDEQHDRWLKALAAYQMTWPQLVDLNAWESELVKYFGIKGIPSTLLIDPKGFIVAKDLRGISLQKRMNELFGPPQ
jgi:peroxiredoxin